mgnify:CR=1 FL=1
MFPNFKREHIQIASTIFLLTGISFVWLSPITMHGIILIGVSCWIMLISESVLLSKVQNEMTVALEALRKKQEIEVKDLLFYLRQSELGNSPWANMDAAKNYINKIDFPAIISDSGGLCVAVNKALSITMGWDKDFIGEHCHPLHRPDIYGNYLHGIEAGLKSGKQFMHSRLSMYNKDGEEIDGTVAIMFLADRRSAVGIWLPDKFGILKSL